MLVAVLVTVMPETAPVTRRWISETIVAVAIAGVGCSNWARCTRAHLSGAERTSIPPAGPTDMDCWSSEKTPSGTNSTSPEG